MTKVHCDYSSCEFYKKDGIFGLCQCEEIELEDCDCNSYRDHTEISPEYRETFWKRIKGRKSGKILKQEGRGKCCEMIGMVWYTEQDDRWGIDEIFFTGARSGLKIKGCDIKEELKPKIRERVLTDPPVQDLEEADLDDCYL